MLKKIVFSFLASVILFFSFAPYMQVSAATPAPTATSTWYNTSFGDWWAKVYDPSNPNEIFGERYTAAQVQWVVYSLFAFLINSVSGPQNASILSCIVSSQKDPATCIKSISGITGSLPTLPTVAKVDLWKEVFATNRSFSGIAYVKDTVQNFNLVPTAHAQTVGFGFSALSPVQEVWRSFRDISFGLFVIVAIVFAFMIMFRVKINPQTVITVQSAIPKIIITLILVTFSYAIAGFLVDLMYVVIGLVSLVGSQFVHIPAGNVFNFLTLGQPFGVNAQAGVLGLIVLYLIIFVGGLTILLVINAGVLGTALAAGIGIAIIASPLAPILALLVIIIAVIAILIAIWHSLKILWSLIKAFVNILLLTIFAPLQLTAGTVIPSFGFGQWLRSFVSNLAVFVVTGVLFLLSFAFLALGVQIGMDSVGVGSVWNIVAKVLVGNGGLATQAFTGNPNGWPPLLGVGGGATVGLLFLAVSFVLFTLIPKANELIQAALSGKPFAYGTAIGEALAPVGFAYGRTIGPGISELQRYQSGMLTANLATAVQNYLKQNPNIANNLPKSVKGFIDTAAIQPGGSPYKGKP